MASRFRDANLSFNFWDSQQRRCHLRLTDCDRGPAVKFEMADGKGKHTVVVILVRESKKVQINVRSSCDRRKIGHLGPVLMVGSDAAARYCVAVLPERLELRVTRALEV
eukprot:COSAG01_NODE_6178_length_3808_cov_67.968994_2_plen_109_part_00